MTMQQITIVKECNEAMRYFASRLQSAIKGSLPGHLDWRALKAIADYCNAEFEQIRILRDFIRFGR